MSNRKIYFDIIRIFSCFFVIINHTMYTFDKYGNISMGNWMVSNYLFFISKMAVPLFIIMSGALLLNREESYKKIYINRFLKTGIILFIWSIIYSIFYRQRMLNIDDIIILTKEIIKKPISIHFWYLYMLLGLYLMTPFIRKMVKNFKKEDYYYYFILWTIFSVLLPFARVFKKIEYSSYFGIQIFSGYIGYYILGNFLNKIEITRKIFIYCCNLFILSIVSSTSITYYLSYMTGKTSRSLDNVLMPTIVISAVSFFIIIKYLFNNRNSSNKYWERIVCNISNKTFGIYLIHMLLHTIMSKTNLYIQVTSWCINPIIPIIVYDLLIFLFGYLIITIIKKIPLIKNIA